MKVLNIVFNRLGNSVSVLIDYPHIQIQLFDEVCFTVKGAYVEVSGFTVDTQPPFEAKLNIKKGTEDVRVVLQFGEDGLIVPDVGFFEPVSEGFSGSLEDPDMVFRLGMETGLIKDGRPFLHQENFFKNVSQLILTSLMR